MSSETGHAKNVANFETLISFCTGYGSTYNPSNEALKIASLQTKLTAAKAVIADCKEKETIFDNATDARRDSFEALKTLGTKVINALLVSGVPDSVVEGAKTINRKLQGQRAPSSAKKSVTITAAESEPSIPDTKSSSSQQSYDNLVEHFNGLIELASSHTEYSPNETELKIIALKSYLTELRNANTAVGNANTVWSNSRITRNTELYEATTGLVKTALNTKAYIKSVFGTSSPQFAQVKGLEFKVRPD